MVTPGIAYFGDNQLLLDSNMMADKIEELMDLPIRMEPSNNVFLRDIGDIRGFRHYPDLARPHCQRGIALGGPQPGLRAHLSPARRQLPRRRQWRAKALTRIHGGTCPPGTKLDFVMDQTIFVRQAIHSLIQEGIIGAILVSIMILIFLGNWRMTLIASMSIPLAILGAIIGLYVTGNTINAMTLGGLALAIGPLVDDAIVELENNHRNYSLGKSRVRAALDGCAEVMIPVLVATLHDEHRAGAGGVAAGHGRLPVPSAGPGRRLRHVQLLLAVADLRPDDVRQVPARRSSPPRRRCAAAAAQGRSRPRRACAQQPSSAGFITASRNSSTRPLRSIRTC